jgi:hypothetical protein
MNLQSFERRLDALKEERARAAAQFGEQDPRVLELNKQLEAMARELERAREVARRVAVAVVEAGPGGAVTRVTGPGAHLAIARARRREHSAANENETRQPGLPGGRKRALASRAS